jgi:diadenosine tetraphosphate (Ap4A) HIT family hydrolase
METQDRLNRLRDEGLLPRPGDERRAGNGSNRPRHPRRRAGRDRRRNFRRSNPFTRRIRTDQCMNGLMPTERWPNEDEMIAELYGGAWADPESWVARCRPDGCVVCVSGHPYGILQEFAHTWVTTDAEVAIFGYVCVISKVHAVEPYDLSEEAQTTFWSDCLAVARALSHALRPVKMNYEIHGNTLPHLHMHLLPRQPDDAFVGRPIDLKEFHHRYSDGDISMLKGVLASVSNAGGGDEAI